MINHDAARARAAASAHPDSGGRSRNVTTWPDALRRPSQLDPSEPDDRAWTAQAACRGMAVELFFPDRGVPGDDAKATCQACPVQQQCLDYALANGEEFGVWGGTSERERRGIRWALKRERPLAPINHGTRGGYFVHKARSEEPCASCVEAYRERERERRQAQFDAKRKQKDKEAS